MASSNVLSYEGPLAVNYEPLRGVVKDILSGDARGLRREKEGIAKVLAELTSCSPEFATSLGIGGELLARIATQTAHLSEVRDARVILDKLAEVFEETEACLEDEREGAIGLVVDSVRRASRLHPTALITFEETVRYHGQIGFRAAKTRKKREKQGTATGEAAPAPGASSPEAEPKENPSGPKTPPAL